MNESEMFKHELSSIPFSLFEDDVLMKIPTKPELSKAIAKLCRVDPFSTKIPSSDVSFVLDDGSFLHRVPLFVKYIFTA